MNRRIVNVLILSILCISLLPITGNFENSAVPNAAYTPHNSIIINSNAELATFCSSYGSGSGTAEDPYIIENFSFSGNSTAISISNTNAYLCIRNNYFASQTSSSISISTAQNVNVSSNIIWKASRGIRAISSQNIVIHNNTVNDSNNGLYLFRSLNLKVQSNIIQKISINGIENQQTNSSQFIANIFEDCGSYGIKSMFYQTNNNYTGNLLTRCGFHFDKGADTLFIDPSNKVNGKSVRYYEGKTGISLIDEPDVGQLILINVNNSVFRGLNVSCSTSGIMCIRSHNNTFSDIVSNYNAESGFYMLFSSYNTITLSNFEFNTNGLRIEYSNYIKIAGNRITNNTQFGFNCILFNFSQLYYNAFINNNNDLEMANVQNNTWDNGLRGNYWSKFQIFYPSAENNGIIWTTPHTLYNDGEIVEQDRYPLAYIPFSSFVAPTLSAPSNQSSDGSIILQWNYILEAGHYLVYRSDSEITSVQGLTPIANVTGTSYTDSVSEGTYYYAVVAVNEFKSSGISNNVQIKVGSQPDNNNDNDNTSNIDGFPFAIFGIVCVITLIVKRKRIGALSN